MVHRFSSRVRILRRETDRPVQSSRGTKRAGKFKASYASSPTADGERPVSFDDGAQRYRSSQENPGEALLTSIDQMVATAHAVIQANAGFDDIDPDSAKAFAWRVIGRSGELRSRIMNASVELPDAVGLANDTMHLALLHHAMVIEFVEGKGIGSWSELIEQRRDGARKSAKVRLGKARAHRTVWQREANQIWARNPNLSKNQVADKVHQKLKSQFSVHTIRQAIKKSDIKQCSPSASGVT